MSGGLNLWCAKSYRRHSPKPQKSPTALVMNSNGRVWLYCTCEWRTVYRNPPGKRGDECIGCGIIVRFSISIVTRWSLAIISGITLGQYSPFSDQAYGAMAPSICAARFTDKPLSGAVQGRKRAGECGADVFGATPQRAKEHCLPHQIPQGRCGNRRDELGLATLPGRQRLRFASFSLIPARNGACGRSRSADQQWITF
jgi:hypothetical protein